MGHVLLALALLGTPTAADSAQSWATVELLTSLTTLQEHRPGTIYLVLTNKTTDSLRVIRVASHTPLFVTDTIRDYAHARATLPPGATRIVTVDVYAGKAVQAGKHLLVFEVEFGRYRPIRRATFLASREVDVGIFGESEILTLLGVPSFFVLPGFLIVATVALLWSQWGVPNAAGQIPAFPLKLKESDFWLVAVTLSLLGAVVYPVFAGRSYLDGYGMRDIMTVWFSCVGLAIAGFTAVTGVWKAVRRTRAREVALMVPARTDDPLDTLEKLSRRKLPMTLEQVEVTVGAKPERGFLLERDLGSTDELWVAPGIILTQLVTATQAHRDQLDELRRKDNGGALAAFLRSADGLGSFDVKWQQRETLKGPRRVLRPSVRQVAGPTSIVVEVV